jgi:hypothetical protein
MTKKGDLGAGGAVTSSKMTGVREVSHMCFVRVCQVFFPDRTKVFLTLAYGESRMGTILYAPFCACKLHYCTHVIIIISTIVQYSTVSVLVLYYCVV